MIPMSLGRRLRCALADEFARALSVDITAAQIDQANVDATKEPPPVPPDWRVANIPSELLDLWRSVAQDQADRPLEAGCAHPPDRRLFPDVPTVVLDAADEALRPDPLPFATFSPGANFPTPVPEDPERRIALAKATMKDIMAGAVSVAFVHTSSRVDGDLLPVFMVRQHAGKWRIIHDARLTNLGLPRSSAAYEYVSDVLHYPDAVVSTRLDLWSAYRQVGLHPTDRRRLGFRIGTAVAFYDALPFGLSWAPARFLAAVRPAILQARAEGYYVIWYMDDILVLGRDIRHFVDGVKRVVQLLGHLGLRVAADKFFPVAASRLDFIGHVIDFDQGTIEPTARRLEELTSLARSMAAAATVSCEDLQRVAGVLAFMAGPAGVRFPFRSLHPTISAMRSARLTFALNTPILRQELLAISALTTDDLVYHFRDDLQRRSRPPIHITGDANEPGWAAVASLNGDVTVARSGPWSSEDLTLFHSSAAREIEAVRRAVIAFDLRDCAVVYTSDARAAIAAICHRAKAAGTAAATFALLAELRARRLSLDMAWCSRELGLLPLADAVARLHPLSNGCPVTAEWALRPAAFAESCRLLGLQPTVDLFASAPLHQLPRFCSRTPCVDGSIGGGHTLPLESEIPFVFAPWSQLRRALLRIAGPGGPQRAIVVVRVDSSCKGFTTLAALESAGIIRVTAAVALHHSCLVAATGAPATRQLWPLRVLRLERGGNGGGAVAPCTTAGPGQPLWWSREDLVCVEHNPGPGGDDEWDDAAAVRVTPAADSAPSIAAVARALQSPGSDPLGEVAAVVRDAVAPEVLGRLAALHAAFTPQSTAESHVRAAKEFGAYVRANARPRAAWTDAVACTLLAAWADTLASPGRRLKAKTIRTYVYAARAVLRLWGVPVQDTARILQSALYRIGCLRRDIASTKVPFTLEHLEAMFEAVKARGLLADPRYLMLLAGMTLAFALVLRGETLRALFPRHVQVRGDAVTLDFEGKRKNDPVFKAADPQGLKVGRACQLAARCLSMWLACLPPSWQGPLFPRLVRERAPRGTTTHAGYQWIMEPMSRDAWNRAIKELCALANVKDHLTTHCLRVGGAQDVYRRSGGNLRLVRRTGDWSSDAVFLYLGMAVEEAIDLSRGGELGPSTGGSDVKSSVGAARASGAGDPISTTHGTTPTVSATFRPTTHASAQRALEDDDDEVCDPATSSQIRGPLVGTCGLCASPLGPSTRAAMCAMHSCALMCCKACHPKRDLRYTWHCPLHAALGDA